MERLSSKIVYECKRFSVEEAIYKGDNGKTYERDHVLTPHAVAILPVTKDGKIIFVKETRTAIGDLESYDLPAGIIKNGEKPEIAAIRELEEETGYVTNNVKFLREYYASKGYTNEKIYLYLADMLDTKTSQNLDDGEEINIYEFDYDEVMRMLDNGELNSAPLNISLLMYRNIKEKSK